MGGGTKNEGRAWNQNFDNFSSPFKKRKVDFKQKLNFWRLENTKNTKTSNLEELPGGSAALTKKGSDLAHFTE